jgi:hypothetical protein
LPIRSAPTASCGGLSGQIRQGIRPAAQRIANAGQRGFGRVALMHQFGQRRDRHVATLARGGFSKVSEDRLIDARLDRVRTNRKGRWRVSGAAQSLPRAFERRLPPLDRRGNPFKRHTLRLALCNLAFEEGHRNADLPGTGQGGVDPLLWRLHLRVRRNGA